MASLWSSALRSPGGYGANKPVTSQAPTFTQMPQMPTLPSMPDNAPNAPGRSWLQTQLANLPGKYNPLLTQARADAQAGLAGYGGVSFGTDNPNTPEREDLVIRFDPNAPLGEKEKQGVKNQSNVDNASGLLFSSFHNQNIGNVLARMTEEKRNVVTQFSAQINNALNNQANEMVSIGNELARLYGEDARWFADRPPVTPTLPPNSYNGSPYNNEQIEQSAAPYFAMPQLPANNAMPAGVDKSKWTNPKPTYKAWLNGRTSTAALAAKWRSL